MDLRELESYRLGDAVKFNDDLNPVLWGSDEHLRPEVREKLMAIADDFREFLGLDDLKIRDITVSGSNAAYTYTPHSDIDLHLVVDIPNDPVYRELFDAKKYQYNNQHNFTIGDYDVELYVQDADQPHYSQGIYSLVNNDWVSVPKRRKPRIDDISVKSKYEDLGHRIDAAIDSGDMSEMDAVAKKVKTLRQAGLEQTGEFGAENLAFKVLRNNGTLDRLRQARQSAKDKLMSLEERRKKKNKKNFKYGSFGGYYFPGYHYYGQTDANSDGGGDGVESVKESQEPSIEQQLEKFVKFASAKLNLKQVPQIKIKRDPEWSKRNKTFGKYLPDDGVLYLSIANRHPIDIMRTLAHELTHHHQHERDDMPDHAGDTGSRHENEANTMAGIIMRDFDQANPGMFKQEPIIDEGWREKAAGVAAAACIAGTPGCATMGSDVGRAVRDVQTVGRTAQSIKQMGTHGARDELIQRMRDELRRGTGRNESIADEDYDPNGTPPGPETPPTMPAGTVKVDVSDVYDWYKLGQHISNLKGLGKHDFGAGPPSTILSFGDENTEHKYIKDLEKTGLTTTDIDPKDPKQPRGMKRQKVDPTYNVAEASGYIPTAAEKNDPRYSMALTVDVKPGETGRQANKLGLKTDSQGRPALLMKELENKLRIVKEGSEIHKKLILYIDGKPAATYDDSYRAQTDIDHLKKKFPNKQFELKQETCSIKDVQQLEESIAQNSDLFEQELMEVKMSPGELRRWAASPEAQGIVAGFEAELIFRDTQNDDEDQDQEPDYDYDERARDIEEVIEFFSNDDWGYGLSGRSARDLREQLFNAYTEWSDEQISDEWDNVAEDQVREYMEENVWNEEMEDRIRNTAEQMFPDDDVDEIMAAGDAAPRFTKVSDQQEYVKEHELYQKYLDATDEAHEEFEQEVMNEIQDQGDYYERARDQYFEDQREDGNYDQDDFFRENYRYMSDVAEEFSLDWPYWTGGGGNGGSRSWDSIAESLHDVVGMDVKVGSGYHSMTRKPDRWIMEPDGSLDPDDSTDAGIEIVSPPMPLDKTLQQLQAVINWANNPSEGDAYTNSSTGLHMGISVPFKGGDVDYVKLILFMGDQYVLDKFDRAGNHYCASALEKLKQTQRARQQGGRDPERTATALELIQKNLIELAQRYVQDGVGQQKYTSAHIKDGYIEFRSPGGDYLSLSDREDDAIANTMLRFARAMYIASRPDLYRDEYAKKLYKLIGRPGNDALKLFTEFASGRLNRDELKTRWAEEVLQKDAPEEIKKSTWQLYNKTTGKPVPGEQYGGYTYDEAMQKAKAKISPGSSQTDFNKTYELLDTAANTGKWAVVDGRNQEVIDVIDAPVRGDAVDQAHEKYSGQGFEFYIRPYVDFDKVRKPLSRRAEIARRIKQPKIPPAQAADNARDSRDLERNLRGTVGEPVPAGTVGQQPTPQGGQFTGSWEIVDDNNEVLYTFSGVGNVQADANRVAAQWIRNHPTTGGLTVRPVLA